MTSTPGAMRIEVTMRPMKDLSVAHSISARDFETFTLGQFVGQQVAFLTRKFDDDLEKRAAWGIRWPPTVDRVKVCLRTKAKLQVPWGEPDSESRLLKDLVFASSDVVILRWKCDPVAPDDTREEFPWRDLPGISRANPNVKALAEIGVTFCDKRRKANDVGDSASRYKDLLVEDRAETAIGTDVVISNTGFLLDQLRKVNLVRWNATLPASFSLAKLRRLLPKLSTFSAGGFTLLKQLVEKSKPPGVDDLIREGVVGFDFLEDVFPVGTEVFVGEPRSFGGLEGYGAVVRSFEYVAATAETPELFSMRVELVASNGIEFYVRRRKVLLPYFDELVPVRSLKVRPIAAEERESLATRGRVYEKLSIGVHHRQSNDAEARFGYGNRARVLRDKGRIVVDLVGYRNASDNGPKKFHPVDGLGTSLDETTVWRTPPTVRAFSFAFREFGKYTVSDVGDVAYQSDAWNRVVLPEETKNLVRSLVEHAGASDFVDIVPEKGGGCLLLFHGPPGGGKTVTAEAIAESLGRPLYSVNVVDIGVDVQAVAKNLPRVLRLAERWAAVLLFDEVDVFVTQRNVHDVKRNALVASFLTQLEKQNGVVVLTTNLPLQLDRAFQSRISVSIEYPELGVEERAEVWRNLLPVSVLFKLDREQWNQLFSLRLSGREIKNAVRNSTAIAKGAGRESVEFQDLFLAARYAGKLL